MRPTLTCVEGVGMHRHSAHLMRFAGGALVATVIAPWLGGAVAHADSLVSGDPRATAVSGNIHDQGDSTICSQLGFASDSQVGGDNSAGYNANGTEFDSDGTYLDAVSVPAGKQIDVVVVKAGDFYNRYPSPAYPTLFSTLPVNGMHGPLVGQTQNVPAISHWAACIGDAPAQTAPSVSFNDTCQGIDADFTAGTGGTDFSVTPPGSNSSTTVHVDTTLTQSYAADATNSTITVTWPDNEVPVTHSWTDPGNCTSQPVTDPAVSFANSCKSGITVTLTNMRVDDTTTDPVTFTIVTPSGATQNVTVRADQLVRLSYKVKEDTTATVTVSAPGLTATTHSYAKNCTNVLGEKVVRTPKTTKPAVKGEQAQLPFTGMPTALVALLGAVMLAVGGALNVLGRKRQDEVSAS